MSPATSSFYFIEETSSTSTSGSMSFMHSHSCYELYFLLDGEKRYITSSHLYKIKKNSLVVTAPLVLHQFESGPYRRILIQLTKDNLSPAQIEFLDYLAKQDVVTFSDKQMDAIRKTLEQMLKLFNSPTKDSRMLFYLLLGKLFIYAYYHGKSIESSVRVDNENGPMTVTPTMMKILDYIQHNFTSQISLDFLSKEFGISKTWLIKCFTQTTQMTVIEYKLNLQLSKAKNLLVSTDKPLDKIAKECGFSSANYFGMIFKKYVGVSPTRYCKHKRRKN